MFVIFLFAVLPSLLFLGIVYVVQNRKKFKSRPRKKKAKVRISNDPLQDKFLAMLGGNAATAQRLLDHEKQMNPGHHDRWYLEKVIWRLERDRH